MRSLVFSGMCGITPDVGVCRTTAGVFRRNKEIALKYVRMILFNFSLRKTGTYDLQGLFEWYSGFLRFNIQAIYLAVNKLVFDVF